MAKTELLQTNFSAGELHPAIALRRDTQQYRDGAKSLLNSRILVGGGAKRRPGSWRLAELEDVPMLVDFVVDEDTKYVLAFSDGRMDAYAVDVDDGSVSAAGEVTGGPWSDETIFEMDWAISGNTILLTHTEFLQVITRTGAATWTLGDFDFHTAATGRIHQPHYKVAAQAITLTPSAETGSVTLTASAALFTSDYVDKKIRLLDRELLITAVGGTTTATATVQERLRPTQRLSVATLNTLKVDDVIQGEDTGARGQIVSTGGNLSTATAAAIVAAGTLYTAGDTLTVVGGTGTAATITVDTVGGGGDVTAATIATGGLYSSTPTNPVSVTGGTGSGATFNLTYSVNTTTVTVVIIEKLTKFTAETIIGPDDNVECSAAVDAAPGAVKDWTEQLYSDVNGYPRCVEIHRGRILFAGSNGAKNAVAGSAIANVFSFDIGTGGDADGFLETIGDAAAVTIEQMHSEEQLLLFTDRGPYYVPESPANPFRPTSLAFNRFGSTWPTSGPRVGAFDTGVVLVSKSTVIKGFKTGNTTAFWDALEKSFLSPHLVASPIDAAFCANYADGPERYGLFVNSDGTAAVMQLVDAEQIRNFVPWETEGAYVSFCTLGPFIYAATRRTFNGVDEYWLERFDDALTLDGVTEYETEAEMDAGFSATYHGADVHVCTEDMKYLGEYPTEYVELPEGPYHLGFFYDREIKTLPPNVEQGSKYGDRMRIMTADIGVLESAHFEANGTELSAYYWDEDPSAPPPLRTGPRHFDFLGSGSLDEPTLTIVQPHALPLTITGIKTKVAY